MCLPYSDEHNFFMCISLFICLVVYLFIYLVVASFLCGSCTGKIDEGGEGE